jgi:hypothetical protein
MPRNASGTFSLVSGNPVVSGTLIDATWANNTLNDIANEMTDSLSRSGEGGMLAPLRLTDGVQATPGLGFTNEPGSGLYRAGTNEWWSVAGGAQVQQHTANGAVTRFAAGAVGTPSLSAFGDVNTGLWFPAADTLAASVGGVEGWRLNSSGNMGIGTSSPAQRLDVTGAGNSVQARFGAVAGRGLTIGTAVIAGTNDAGVIFNAPITEGTLIFQTNSTERARIDSSGNLGIGTSSPGQRLAVRSTDNLGSTVIGRFESNNAAQAVQIRFASVLGDSGNVTFGTSTAHATLFAINNNEVARFDTSGNLGIGTANPGTFGKFASVAASGATSVYTGTGVQGLFISTNESTRVVRYDSSGSLSGLHAWGNGPTELMRLDSSGNLGIGTSSPTQRLHVVGGNYRQNDATNSFGFELQNGTGTSRLVTISGGSAFAIQTGNNAIDYLNLDGNGNVTIGSNNVATTATNGFLYVPTCAGTPTGTPTAKSGFAPIVVDTTNNRWYFYSGGAWRNAGP